MINDFLKNYVGFTAKESVLADIQKSLVQEKAKAIGYESKMMPIATVRVEDPKTKEILGIGASVPNDLINNNWGELFAAIHGPLTTSRTFSGLDDIGGGGPYTIRVFRPASGELWDALQKSSVQVGSGVTPAARGDLNIETAFGSAPESGRVATGAGGYNSAQGTVTITTSISPTGGLGTVNEAGMFWEIRDDPGGILRIFCMSRDIISPGVAFVGGQAIVPVYTYQL